MRGSNVTQTMEIRSLGCEVLCCCFEEGGDCIFVLSVSKRRSEKMQWRKWSMPTLIGWCEVCARECRLCYAAWVLSINPLVFRDSMLSARVEGNDRPFLASD